MVNHRQLKTRPPLRICIVTAEFLGLYETSQLAASVTAFAQEAAAFGDTVTVLIARPAMGRTTVDEGALTRLRRHYYEHYGIHLEVLTGSDALLPGLHSSAKTSLTVYHHLQEQNFDAVYFTIESGLGYYSILGRELGTFPTSSKLIVVANEPLAWEAEADRFFLNTTEQVATAFMERYTAEHCDELILSSTELKRSLKAKNWAIPRTTKILDPFLPAEWTSSEHSKSRNRQVGELVFIGGLGFRTGLTLFCDILDKLAERDLPRLQVTLLGPFDRILGEHTGGMMLRRGRAWPFELNFLPRVTPQESISYLKHRNCLVVSPALAAAAPFDVALCLQEGIPFVASNAGDIPNMVAPPDRKLFLCDPTAAALAQRIGELVQSGARPAKPAKSIDQKRSKLADHLADVALSTRGSSKTTHSKKRTKQEQPLVSIIMAHHDRHDLVRQAIKSVERQDYRNIELILVDDGSVEKESRELLDRLEPDFKKRGWRILREENRYLGAARNAGIRASRGERILFLDDDNILFENAVSTFVAAMDHSGADICTSLSKILYGKAEPTSENRGQIQYFPLGGCLDLALIHNSFGDANAMIRKSVFKRIGYLNEEYGFVAQDWEFFARAALNGLKVRIIPEPLYWYRSDPQGMYRSSHWVNTRHTILKLYQEHHYQGLEHLYHLVLAQNVDPSEAEGFHHNLMFSPSDSEHLKLRKFEPNSDHAIDLLAEIAAAEGRAGTAIVLMGQRKKEGWLGCFLDDFVAPQLPDQVALAEAAARTTTTRILSESDLRDAEVRSSEGAELKPLTYTEDKGHLYLEASPGSVSVAILEARSPAGLLSVSTSVFLDQAEPEDTEFMIFLADVGEDPFAAIERLTLSGEASSGWCKITRAYEVSEIEAALPSPSTEPKSIVFAVRATKNTTSHTLGCFSHICERSALDPNVPVHRPRRKAPPHRQRARILERFELETAQLATPNGNIQKILSFPDGEDGILLQPTGREVVAATLPWGLAPFAQKIVASVEVAQEDIAGFKFGMALTRPDQHINWTAMGPDSCVVFSGWHEVSDPFELRKFAVTVPEVTRTHLALQIATLGSRPSYSVPPETYWRKFVLYWE